MIQIGSAGINNNVTTISIYVKYQEITPQQYGLILTTYDSVISSTIKLLLKNFSEGGYKYMGKVSLEEIEDAIFFKMVISSIDDSHSILTSVDIIEIAKFIKDNVNSPIFVAPAILYLTREIFRWYFEFREKTRSVRLQDLEIEKKIFENLKLKQELIKLPGIDDVDKTIKELNLEDNIYMNNIISELQKLDHSISHSRITEFKIEEQIIIKRAT